jgi:hypothetical protein
VKVLTIGKRKKFTIIEGIKMYQACGAQKLNNINPSFW